MKNFKFLLAAFAFVLPFLSTAQVEQRYEDADNSAYVGISAPATVQAPYSLKWPDELGNDGDQMTLGANGQLEWDSPVNVVNQTYASGGAVIWATGPGVTFSINATTGEWTFSIPTGVELKKAAITFASSDTDGSNKAYLIFDYAGDRGFNGAIGECNVPFVGVHTIGTPSRSAPLNMATGGIPTGFKQYGISAFGGGDGSDLEITVANAPEGPNNVMHVNFSN